MRWPGIEVVLFAGLTVVTLLAVVAVLVIRNGRRTSDLAKHG